ncbi:MAG TPA: flagellar biosynthesis anti-sigma factor FlgM [Methylophaga sp.]|nr:flagellar biosynthesis anti-sigma factor FlgM [Methylophaga sp.]
MSEINNIKTNLPGTVNNPRSNSVNDKNSTSKTSTDAAPASDKFSLTDDANQLQALREMVAGMPDVDKQRIADLRAAIENGDYQVDSQKLAQNMIDFEGQF